MALPFLMFAQVMLSAGRLLFSLNPQLAYTIRVHNWIPVVPAASHSSPYIPS
jgi:hypothetical protein